MKEAGAWMNVHLLVCRELEKRGHEVDGEEYGGGGREEGGQGGLDGSMEKQESKAIAALFSLIRKWITILHAKPKQLNNYIHT